MKKVVLVVLAFAGMLLANNNVEAQTVKVGVFDVDIAVTNMPGYRVVDSMLQIYEQDSLKGEYDYNLKEYNRLDSTYKADSAKKAPASVLNYIKQDRTRFATQIIYWQQISQQKTEQKRQQLASPMFEKVLTAYENVLKTNKYLVVLKPGAYEIGSNVENVFEKVFKEMKLPVPPQLQSQQGTQAADEPAARPSAPATKPAPKKQ